MDIFKKQAKVFWAVVLLCTLAAVAWQKSQPQNSQATLLLNIGRSGVQNTQDYTYDDFYRLQADERFADTVVRWLGSPRVVEDIYTTAGLDAGNMGTRTLQNIFGAKRLSSQMIEVTYGHTDEKVLLKISVAAVATLNRYAESLNTENKGTTWFVVIGSDPVIRDARISAPLALAIGLACGVFIGFWTGLIRHYLTDDKKSR